MNFIVGIIAGWIASIWYLSPETFGCITDSVMRITDAVSK
jgi:uncharacterized membrane protein YeaQ/YmgE (transglycosylase-associated protein family)